MSTPDSTSTTNLTPLERELREFIVSELLPSERSEPITADEDLIKRGIVDSLGVTQLVAFCESRYRFRVTDADLVLTNFQTVRQLADFVERKRGKRDGRPRFLSRAR
jgi:acyl carrier protein